MRGFLVRRRLERERAAAVTIQRAVRAHQERRRRAAVAAVKQQMAEMAALMREYQRRTASALRIQVCPRHEVLAQGLARVNPLCGRFQLLVT